MKLRTTFILTLIGFLSITACNKAELENIPFLLILTDDTGSVDFGESIQFDILKNDVIDGDEISISIIGEPEYGAVTLIPGVDEMKYGYKHAGLGLDSENQLTPDQFTYEVCVDGNCETADVKIGINEVIITNECIAYARNNSYTTLTGYIEMNISEILENDVTPCSEWDIDRFKKVSNPSYGTARVVGDILIFRIPQAVYWERDEFIYEICDQKNQCKTATIKIINGNIVAPTQL